MPRPRPAPETALLRRRWRQWTRMVEHVVGRRWRQVDAKVYDRLYQELLSTCDLLAGEAPPEKRAYYARLHDVVLPWMTLGILARTDPELLLALLHRCRALGRELGGPAWLGVVWQLAVQVLLALVLAAGLIPLGWMTSQTALPVVERVQDWSRELWLAIKYSSPTERLLMGGIVVTLTTVCIVSRSARS